MKNLFKVFIAFVMACVMGAFISCEVGLGKQVDVGYPSFSIDYPPTDSVIRDEFIIEGTCTDDMGVSAMKVKIINNSSNSSEEWQNAEIIDDGRNNKEGKWRIKVQPYTVNEDGQRVYKYYDGSYTAQVVAYDRAGHKSTVGSISFAIDNTAPVFVVTSPASMKLASPTPYGRKFSVAGQVSEDHVISKLNVKVFDKDENLVGPVLTFNNVEPSTISSGKIIAQWSTQAQEYLDKTTSLNPGDEAVELHLNYLSIYNGRTITKENYSKSSDAIDMSKPEALETQNYNVVIEMIDNAMSYKGLDVEQSPSGENALGNITQSYYNNDKINKSILTKYKLTIDDLKKILNGTYFRKGSREVADDGTIAEILQLLEENIVDGKTVKSAFSLNPDASPKYTVIGTVYGTDAVKSITSNQKAKGTTISYTVTSGRDNTPVEPWNFNVLFYEGTLDRIENKYVFDEYPYVIRNMGYEEDTGSVTGYTGSFSLSSYYTLPNDYVFDEDDGLKEAVHDVTDEFGFRKVVDVVKRLGKDEDGNWIYDTTDVLKFVTNRVYNIVIEGNDQNGESIYPEGQLKYGCIIASNGNPPQIKFNETDDDENLNPVTNVFRNNGDVNYSGVINTEKDITKIEVTLAVYNSEDNSIYAEGTKEYLLGDGSGVVTFDRTEDGVNYYDWQFNLNSFIEAQEDLATLVEEDEETGVEYHPLLENTKSLYTYAISVSTVDTENKPGGPIQRFLNIDPVSPKIDLTEDFISPYQTNEKISNHNVINGGVYVKSLINEANIKNVWYTVTSNGNKITQTDASGKETEEFGFSTGARIADFFYTYGDHYSVQVADNSEITFTVHAVDKAGNKSSASKTFFVNQSSDAPKIEFTNINTSLKTVDDIKNANDNREAKTNIFELNKAITGVVTDDDGIASVKITLCQDSKCEIPVPGIEPFVKESSGNEKIGTSYNLNGFLTPDKEGTYFLKVEIEDVNYGTPDKTDYSITTEKGYIIAVDVGAPSITMGVPSGRYFSKTSTDANRTITATIADSSGSLEIYAVGYAGGSGSTEEIKNKDNSIQETSTNWKDPTPVEKTSFDFKDILLPSDKDGMYTYHIVAKDKFGRENSNYITYNVDGSAPTVIPAFEAGTEALPNGVTTTNSRINFIVSDKYTKDGTTYGDSYSGVVASSIVWKNEYYEDGVWKEGDNGIFKNLVAANEIDPASDLYKKYITTQLPASVTGTEKLADFQIITGDVILQNSTKNRLSFEITDNAGNKTVLTNAMYLSVDSEAPTIKVNGLDNAAVDRVALDATSSSGAFTFDVTFEDNMKLAGTAMRAENSEGAVIEGTHFSWAAKGSDSNTSKTRTVTINSGALHDGNWTFTFTATDSASYQKNKTVTILVDSTCPESSITAPVADEVANTGKFTIKGVAEDTLSSIKNVHYEILKGETKLAEGNITPKGATWSQEVIWPDADGNQGVLTLKTVATDSLDNVEATPAILNFYFDKANPELTETNVGEIGATTNNSFTLSGSVTDTNGVEKIDIVLNAKTWTLTKGNGGIVETNWSKEFVVGSSNSTADNYVPDSTANNFRIQAIDLANKKSAEIQRVVKVDTVTPEITSKAIKSTSVDVGGTKWYGSSNINLEVSASDTGLGLNSVQYSTDGGSNWNSMNASGDKDKFVATAIIGDGDFSVTFRATDPAGNIYTDTNALTGKVDTSSPTGTLISVDGQTTNFTEQKLTNGQKDLVVVVEATDPDGVGIGSVVLKDISGTIPKATAAAEKNGDRYTITIKASDLITGTAWIRVTDKVGNFADFNMFSILKDNVAPTASIDSIDDASSFETGIQVNGIINITGKAHDDNALDLTTPVTLEWSKTKDSGYATLGTIAGSVTWSVNNIDTTTAFGSVTSTTPIYIRLKAKDKAGNFGYSPVSTIYVDQNTDRPIIKMANVKLDGTSKLKQTYTLYGTITDDDGAIYSGTTSGTGNTWKAEGMWFTENPSLKAPEEATVASNQWKAVTIDNGSWTAEAAEEGARLWNFWVRDSEGTEFATKNNTALARPYMMDSTTVKPADVSTSIAFAVDTSAPIIEKLYTATALDTGYFYTTSANIESKYWSTANAARLGSGGTALADGSRLIPVGIENGALKCKKAKWEETSDLRYGGNSKSMYVGAVVTEGTGMSSFDVYLGGSSTPTSTLTPVNVGNKYYYCTETPYTMDSNYANGSLTLKAVATDSSDQSTPATRSLIVDNEGPYVTVSYPRPRESDRITSTVTWRGIYQDDSSLITSIKWYIPRAGEVPSVANANGFAWTDITPAENGSSWTIDFNSKSDGNAMNPLTYCNATAYNVTKGAAAGLGDEAFYKVPVYFLMEDSLGNKSVQSSAMIVDQDGGKPIAYISYPTNSADPDTVNGTTIKSTALGGFIRINGTANDIDGASDINEVRMKIDVNGDGSFDAADYAIISGWISEKKAPYYNSIEGKGILKGTSGKDSWYLDVGCHEKVNWSITINQNGEFDELKKDITVQVCAYDKGNTTHGWYGDENGYKVVKFHIDTDSPLIGKNNELYLCKFLDNANPSMTGNPIVAQRTYEEDAFVNSTDGNWWLVGQVTHREGIEKLKLSNKSGLNDDLDNHSKVKFEQVHIATEDQTSKWDYYFFVPLTEAIATSTGNIQITVTAIEGSENKRNASKEISINLDNTPPAIFITTGGLETTSDTSDMRLISGDSIIGNSDGRIVVEQTDNSFTFGDVVKEEGSGFKNVIFYFKRGATNGDTKERVYNPMFSEGNRTNIEAGGVTINSEGLPVKSIAGSLPETSSGSGVSRTFQPTTASNVTGNKNIRVGGLIKVNGIYVTITNIDGSGNVGIDTEIESSDSISVDFVYGMVIDHMSTAESPDISGTGKVVLDPSKDNNVKYVEKQDDGDGLIESVEKAGSLYTWSTTLNSKQLVDGPIEIHVVAFDKAGNSVHGYTTTSVMNNRPRLAKVYLATDLNSNGKYDYSSKYSVVNGIKNFGEVAEYSAVSGTEKSTYLGVLDSKEFTVKKGLLILPEIVNNSGEVSGNGALKYIATIDAEDSENLTNAETSVSPKAFLTKDDAIAKMSASNADTAAMSEIVSSKGGVELTTFTDSFGSKGASNGKRKIKVSIWDSTEGLISGRDSQWAVLNIPLKIKTKDDRAPVMVIDPFYWKGLNDNSVYNSASISKREQLEGHIELGNVPQVSGKISIQGSAYDETKLNTLSFKFDGIKLSTLNSATYGGEVTMATYNPTAGTWTLNNNGTVADNGFKLTINDEFGPIQDGHFVTWQLDVDTEKLDGVTGTGKYLLVKANDGTNGQTAVTTGTQSGAATTTVYASASDASLGIFYNSKANAKARTEESTGNAVKVPGIKAMTASEPDSDGIITYTWKQTNVYQMSVVPYVTKVITNLSKHKVSNPSVYNRTALGHYPVQSVVKNVASGILNTTTSETVTVEGFNIVHSSTAVTNGTSLKTTEPTLTARGKVEFNVENMPSGPMQMTVNGVAMINNSNDNNAHGDAVNPGEQYEHWYNRQGNGDTNNILTDDVVFDVWEFNDRAAKPINGMATGVQMKVNQNSKMLNFAFANGGLYYSMGGNVSGTEYSSYYWAGDWDTFAGPCVGLAVDSLGYTYSVASGGDTNSSGSVDKYNLYTSRWGLGAHSTEGTLSGTNSRRLEEIAIKTGNGTYAYSLMKYRYLSSELATSVTNTTTNLYLVNYDALADEIRFRAGQFANNTVENKGGFHDTYQGGNSSYYATKHCQVIANNSKTGGSFPADDNGAKTTVSPITGRGAGQYVDIAIAKNGTKDVACVVWFDAYDNCLKYTYFSDPIGNWTSGSKIEGDNTAKGWSEPKKIFAEGGEYCQIEVDKNNHIHIAAYAGNGDVKYAYLAAYNSDYDESVNSCVVDASGAVGEHLTLDVALDDSGNSIPYIGYFTAAIKAPKFAYLVDKNHANKVPAGVNEDESFTGAWESTIVPTMSRLTTNREDKINIGVFKTTGGVLNYSTTDGNAPASNKSNIGTNTCSSKTGDYGSSAESSKAYGNGSKNAVFAYQISGGTGSCIETAQMR